MSVCSPYSSCLGWQQKNISATRRPRKHFVIWPSDRNRQNIAIVLAVVVALILGLQIRANKIARAAAHHHARTVAAGTLEKSPGRSVVMENSRAAGASNAALVRSAIRTQPYTVGFSFVVTCVSLGLCWRQMT